MARKLLYLFYLKKQGGIKMEKINLNLIPVQIEKGIITTKEAVNIISQFVSLNYPVFGLQKYDEDFRSDIVLNILEKGVSIMEGYDNKRGDFFTYLFYQIKSLVHARARSTAKRKLESTITMPEKINLIEEKEFKYESIDYNTFETKYLGIPKVPYAYKKEITAEDLRKTFENVHGDKKLLVVAIKSAYYITDSQIKKICDFYKIDENDFFQAIQYCRNGLMIKAEKKLKLQERRNSAYLHHKNLETQIHSIEEKLEEKDNFIKEEFKSRDKRYCKYWKTLNRQLEAGLLSLRPTNKTVASLLGICERQVAYYINCIKNQKSSENKEASGN